jgi:hypothetical protein
MDDTWVSRRIHRDNRRLLIVGLLLWAVAAALGTLIRNPLYNFVRGPFPVDHATLAAIDHPDAEARYYVTFEVAQVSEPVGTVRSSNSKEPHAKYVLAVVKDRPLLLKVSTKHEGNSYTGTIGKPTAEEQAKVVDPLVEKAPGLKAVLLPYVVDTSTRHFHFWAVTGLLAVAVLLGTGLSLIVRALRRTVRPERHPLAQALERFGPSHEVAAAIGQEARVGPVLRVGPVDFVGRWVICSAPKGYKVFRLDDLVWVHKLVVRGQGTQYWAKLFDRHGVSFEVCGKEGKIDGILAAVAAQAPWLIAGYDPRLEQLWKEDPAGLVGYVEQRRQAHRKAVETGPDAGTDGQPGAPDVA